MADLFGDDGEDDMLPEEEEEEGDILDMEGADAGNHHEDALLMRFCPHDSSMLYPQVRYVLPLLIHACVHACIIREDRTSNIALCVCCCYRKISETKSYSTRVGSVDTTNPLLISLSFIDTKW
jgi:hypothetical protein